MAWDSKFNVTFGRLWCNKRNYRGQFIQRQQISELCTNRSQLMNSPFLNIYIPSNFTWHVSTTYALPDTKGCACKCVILPTLTQFGSGNCGVVRRLSSRVDEIRFTGSEILNLYVKKYILQDRLIAWHFTSNSLRNINYFVVWMGFLVQIRAVYFSSHVSSVCYIEER